MAQRRPRKTSPGQLEFDLWGIDEATADETLAAGRDGPTL